MVLAGTAGTVDRAVFVDGLTFSYGHRPVLHGLSFAIGKGEVVGLLGPNGASSRVAASATRQTHPCDRLPMKDLGSHRILIIQRGHLIVDDSLDASRGIHRSPESRRSIPPTYQ